MTDKNIEIKTWKDVERVYEVSKDGAPPETTITLPDGQRLELLFTFPPSRAKVTWGTIGTSE